MDTKKVTTEYRLSQWMQVIQKRQNSGQTIKDFCQEEGINRNLYFYWQKKLRNAACTELEETELKNIVPHGWMQLGPQQNQAINQALEIEINGCRITVNAATDPELLKKVCHTLRSL